MCRWFAYISPSEPCLLEDVLVTPAHALAKQVHEHYLPKLFAHGQDSPEHTSRDEIALRNRFYNIDGMGVVWYTSTRSEFVSPHNPEYGPHPVFYKSLRHPLSDPVFLSLSAHTSTTACFGHIRAALPSSLQPVPTLTEFNCHPFCYGRFTFMHNGIVGDFERMVREVMGLMGEEEARWVKGNTDSEALAGVFFTYLNEEIQEQVDTVHHRNVDLPMLKRALKRTIATVLDIQKRVVAGKQAEITPSNLNLAITDGQVLICCRFRNHQTEQPPSLYYSTTAGVTLNRKFPGHPDGKEATYMDHVFPREKHRQHPHVSRPAEHHGPHVIVASEPTTYKVEEWQLIKKNECIMVEKDGSVFREPLGVEF